MYQSIIATGEMEAAALELPGVSLKVLHTEPNGAMTVQTIMAPGATIPWHWHGEADETVFVLDGDFIENGVSYGPGTFFAGAAKTGHGPHSTVKGCRLLTRFSAALDFQGSQPAPRD